MSDKESRWSEADEKLLMELQLKKVRIIRESRKRVEDVVEAFHTHNMSESDVVDELINHALPLIEALKPFAKL